MSRAFTIKMRRLASKQLSRIPHPFSTKIEKAIDQLAQTPYPHGCKKLVGKELWRIRVGDYSVIYLVADTICVIEIYEIGHRQSIYKN